MIPESDCYRQKGGWCCQGLGQVGMGSKFQFVKMKTFWRWLVVMLHNSVNVLNATELYT